MGSGVLSVEFVGFPLSLPSLLRYLSFLAFGGLKLDGVWFGVSCRIGAGWRLSEI
jgi:hypothetical protein